MTTITRSRAAGGVGFFAHRFGIDARVCDDLLGVALANGGDYADLFFEHTRQRTLIFEEQALRGASSGVSQGVGIRVVHGEATGYAYTEQFDRGAMRQAAGTAATVAAASGGKPIRPQPVAPVEAADRYPVETFSVDAPAETTLALLRRADTAARAVASSIEHVQVRLQEQVKEIAVATSEGRWAGDTQPLVKLIVLALSRRGDDRQQGFESKGLRAGLDVFEGERGPEALGRRAAEQAVLGHDAVDAPAGFLPVVLAAGASGILLHEAVGHGLEADFNRKGFSNFSGRIGEPVASPLCTVVDDGTLPLLQGTINIDDEGHAPRHNVLIENGILRAYLHDWMSARHYGVAPSGSGRRQDFRNVPMPRMTTTYMLPGDTTPEEIIRSVDRGIYCRDFSGGQVNISNGDYVFATSEAYLIEAGRVTAPLRTLNLIGNGPDSMTRVKMVGHDLALSEDAGTCGKNGQWAPVSLGLPTILVDGITLGGTQV